MGDQLKINIAFLLLLFLTACEVADFGGIFISDQSVNQRFEQSMTWNKNHKTHKITVTTDNYTILTMGDSHVGSTKNLDIFFDRAKSINAAAAVMVGDLTTGHASDYAVFQNHIPTPDSLNTFLLAGNHELYFDGWNEFYSRFGSSTYYFTIQTPEAADLYICLDSGGGTLGSKQLNWLKETLQNKRSDYRYCFLLTHNNLFRFRKTASTNPPIEELHVLMELFTVHQVDMVITGHDHKHNARQFGNTIHITMDALEDGKKNAGYFQLNVNNEGLDYNFVNL